MTIGPDEFMRLAFANVDLTKEVPAISCARPNKEGKLGFPAQPYQAGVIVSSMPWHFNITTFACRTRRDLPCPSCVRRKHARDRTR